MLQCTFYETSHDRLEYTLLCVVKLYFIRCKFTYITKKSSRVSLFGIKWNFANSLPIYIYVCLPIFGRFILVFIKVTLIILQVLVYHFKFWVSPSQTAVTLAPRMSAPSLLPVFNSLYYHVWGKAEVLSQAATKSQKQFLCL